MAFVAYKIWWRNFFAFFFLCLTWVHVSLYPLSGISLNIQLSKEFGETERKYVVDECLYSHHLFPWDVRLLLGETGSWSLSCLEKMMLCMLPGVLFMPLTTKCCFSLYFQRFKFLLALLFFVVVMLSLTYVFLIFLLLFSLCHLIFFNKYTQNLFLSVSFSI